MPAQPWTLERAQRFTMPIGKYRGSTMAQIALADPAYLEWCAENLDRGVQKAAQTILEAEPQPAGSVTRPAPAAAEEPEEPFDEFDA
jgi:hypothetical protein